MTGRHTHTNVSRAIARLGGSGLMMALLQLGPCWPSGSTTSPRPTCAAPMIVCGGACIDPRADSGNCGSCGNRCASGTSCQASHCLPTPHDSCGGTLGCDAGTGPTIPCGTPYAACCTTGTPCTSSDSGRYSCVSGTCMPCGQVGQECCAAQSDGFTCTFQTYGGGIQCCSHGDRHVCENVGAGGSCS